MTERQSPVDIPPDAPIHRAGLELRYGSIPLVLGHNPSAVQIDNTAAAAAIIDGHAYGLVQLHMHCPSEHTFSGTHAAMGLHLVHQSAEGALAVVAVTFVEGPANRAIGSIVDALAGEDAPESLDLDGLLPVDRAYVAYEGSLTTPPYSEGVAWRVLVRANTLSADQLAALTAVHDGNARPVQPMNERSFL